MASPKSNIPKSNIPTASSTLEHALEELQKSNKKLQEEKDSLQIRVEGVQTLGNLLKRSQDEANNLKNRVKELLDELNRKEKNASSFSQDSGRFNKELSQRNSEKDETILSERLYSDISNTSLLSSSTLNSADAEELKELLSKLGEMESRNTQLENKMECILKEQKSQNHNEDLLGQIDKLKSEMQNYKQSKGHDAWLDKLSDDTARLQKKLTNTAFKKSSQFSCLQDEINGIRGELGILEDRLSVQKKQDADKQISGNIPPVFKEVDVELSGKVSSSDTTTGNPSPQVVRRKQDDGDPDAANAQPPQIKQVKLRQQNPGQLEEHNCTLQKQVAEFKRTVETISQEKEEIVKINHAWDAQYRKLQEYMNEEIKRRDSNVNKLQRQISDDHRKRNGSDDDVNILEQKDQIIDQLTIDLQLMREEANKLRLDSITRIEPCERKSVEDVWKSAKKMLDDEKKEKVLIQQREQAAQEKCIVMEETVLGLQRLLEAGDARKKFLENEVRRLAHIVETVHLSGGDEGHQGSNSSPPSLAIGEGQGSSARHTSRQMSAITEEQVEVLKQQLAVYAEDFNTERAEKEKIIESHQKQTDEIKALREKLDTSTRQLKIYETDYKKEREERIRLMRICGQLPHESPRFQQNPVGQAEYYMPAYYPPRMEQPMANSNQILKYNEYLQLLLEQQRLSEKLLDMERQGVSRIGQRNVRETFLPNTFYPRGSATAPIPPPDPKDRNSEEMFYGGDVVRDGIQRKLTPPKSTASYGCPTCGFRFRNKEEFLDHSKVCYP